MPPPELVALAWLPALELDALALTAEPTLPVALALAPPPETEVVVITMVDEPPLAVALLETLEPAVALPAPSKRASNRQGGIKLNETFIDTSLRHSMAMIAETAVEKRRGQAAAFTVSASLQLPSISLEDLRWFSKP